MPVIYLQHPRHGQKVAMAEQEATYDEGNGWVRFDPSVAPVVEPEAPEPVEIPDFLNQLAPKRRGRPSKPVAEAAQDTE